MRAARGSEEAACLQLWKVSSCLYPSLTAMSRYPGKGAKLNKCGLFNEVIPCLELEKPG